MVQGASPVRLHRHKPQGHVTPPGSGATANKERTAPYPPPPRARANSLPKPRPSCIAIHVTWATDTIYPRFIWVGRGVGVLRRFRVARGSGRHTHKRCACVPPEHAFASSRKGRPSRRRHQCMESVRGTMHRGKGGISRHHQWGKGAGGEGGQQTRIPNCIGVWFPRCDPTC